MNPEAMDRMASHSDAPPHESPALSPDPPFPPARPSACCNLPGLTFLDEALSSSSSSLLLSPDSKKQTPTHEATREAITIRRRRGIFHNETSRPLQCMQIQKAGTLNGCGGLGLIEGQGRDG